MHCEASIKRYRPSGEVDRSSSKRILFDADSLSSGNCTSSGSKGPSQGGRRFVAFLRGVTPAVAFIVCSWHSRSRECAGPPHPARDTYPEKWPENRRFGRSFVAHLRLLYNLRGGLP